MFVFIVLSINLSSSLMFFPVGDARILDIGHIMTDIQQKIAEILIYFTFFGKIRL